MAVFLEEKNQEIKKLRKRTKRWFSKTHQTSSWPLVCILGIDQDVFQVFDYEDVGKVGIFIWDGDLFEVLWSNLSLSRGMDES